MQNRQDQKEAFLTGGAKETRNPGNLTLPASPYQVVGRKAVAGALVTGIKSDLPGDVIATVTGPVYDTATGKFLLIPQGSRILGNYNSQVRAAARAECGWCGTHQPPRCVTAQARQPGRLGRPGRSCGLALGLYLRWWRR
ncbi:TrbI/VirB10 family protein [Pectobacterium betavasculorum]|uniref:TrbI/VirB10 family protein n=1 Tax=Pectobacterium betavasculorum TaxID=55207 RepID=UPI003CC7A856